MARGKKSGTRTGDLFIDASGQMRLVNKSAEQSAMEDSKVECLGMTFETEAARRAYFIEKLRQRLQDPEFRKIEGFPIADDEAILSLSDPPYYTACPNPFIPDLLGALRLPTSESGSDAGEPFTADVSEGKNDAIYMAHTYHTKVPHKAIMRYLLHYTKPGDVVFDGFAGTGMTGVAAALCGKRSEVESLGYKVDGNGDLVDQQGHKAGELGARHAILNDLSPAASFIAYHYNVSDRAGSFERQCTAALADVERECAWMFETRHESGGGGRINYVVWSDVFSCPRCSSEIVFWAAAVDRSTWQVRDSFGCPSCKALLEKSDLQRVMAASHDPVLRTTIMQVKQVPVLIHYKFDGKTFVKEPDTYDLDLLRQVEETQIRFPVPASRMPEGTEARRNDDAGLTHVHHFYTRRNLLVLSEFAARLGTPRLCINVTSVGTVMTKMYRFRSQGGSLGAGGGPLSGTLYVPSLTKEIPMLKALAEHVKKMSQVKAVMAGRESAWVATGSLTDFKDLPSSSVDYVFTDPPFGSNFMYSELNFIWEAWLGVFTNAGPEAIQSATQRKGLTEYQRLMTRCFSEYYRCLKPGRWMTVEFHNSRNDVWNAIQEALQQAGFVVADVRTLDKKQGSFKQVTSSGTVKQDLVISAYKPNGGLEQQFRLHAGSPEGAWQFVRQHLKHLPVFVELNGIAEPIAERQGFLLFDRMVAFHIQRGATVPLGAAQFYAGLKQKFAEREGMYFLSDQAAEYDRRRLTVKGIAQLELFVSDERSAIQWLRLLLERKPQTYQNIQPQFLRELHKAEHEKLPELRAILQANFLEDEKQRWFVPDPNSQIDLERLREKALLREFEEYKESKLKLLKVFRTEAVRAGFKSAWAARDYETIVSIAQKLPEDVLQEDLTILQYYDNAAMRIG